MTDSPGKVVAITGAGSGIGAATALELGRRGLRVVLGARDRDRLEALAARIRADGGEALAVPTDVRQLPALQALVEAARTRFGRLDVLISNAGIGPISPLDDLRVTDWDAMIDVNLRGVLHGIAAALPVFRAQGSGQFVHVASTAAYRTVPGQAVYSATKVAVRALTDGLRQEVGATVRVTLVSPGYTHTAFTDQVPDPELKRRLDEMGRQFGLAPDAVARAVAFALEQPPDVDVNEIVVRPTAQP